MISINRMVDRFCGLVIRVPGYRSRAPGFDSRSYQIFWEVVGLEPGPLNLVSTIEKLLGRKYSGLSLEIREYGRRDPSRSPRGTLYPQKLALTSRTSGLRSVGIVHSGTHATECINRMVVIYISVLHNYIYYALWYSEDPLNIISNITSFHTQVRGKCQIRGGVLNLKTEYLTICCPSQGHCIISGTVMDEHLG
jgi:hypothetical protein